MNIRWPVFLLAFSGVFFGQVARAHPFGAEIFAHRIEISISHEQLHISYRVEIPTRQRAQEVKSSEIEQQNRFQAQKIDLLLKGLEFRANNERIELHSVDLGENHVRARPHSFTYELHLQGTLPKGTTELRVNNQNYLNERAYFRIDLSLSDDLEVQESSLHKKRGGQPPQDQTGRWWMNESLREFTLAFAAKPNPSPRRRTPLVSGLICTCIVGGLFLRKQHHAKKPS